VAGGGDRQELSEALDEAHDDRFQGENDVHEVLVRVLLWSERGRGAAVLRQAGRKLTTPGSATVELPASGGGFFVVGKISAVPT
jgi:hypothetical protein